MPKMIEVKCACGCDVTFSARVADRARGWGKFASKSCKAKHQERRTGQHRSYHQRKRMAEEGLCFPDMDENAFNGGYA
jgi:hypothetical protein